MATKKTTLIASVASLMLGATLSFPALGAAPTYSGAIFCEGAHDGELWDLGILDAVTRKEAAYWRKYWTVDTGFCANGSFDVSGLTRDA